MATTENGCHGPSSMSTRGATGLSWLLPFFFSSQVSKHIPLNNYQIKSNIILNKSLSLSLLIKNSCSTLARVQSTLHRAQKEHETKETIRERHATQLKYSH